MGHVHASEQVVRLWIRRIRLERTLQDVFDPIGVAEQTVQLRGQKQRLGANLTLGQVRLDVAARGGGVLVREIDDDEPRQGFGGRRVELQRTGKRALRRPLVFLPEPEGAHQRVGLRRIRIFDQERPQLALRTGVVLVANEEKPDQHQTGRHVFAMIVGGRLRELERRINLVAGAMKLGELQLRGQRMRVELQRIVERLSGVVDPVQHKVRSREGQLGLRRPLIAIGGGFDALERFVRPVLGEKQPALDRQGSGVAGLALKHFIDDRIRFLRVALREPNHRNARLGFGVTGLFCRQILECFNGIGEAVHPDVIVCELEPNLRFLGYLDNRLEVWLGVIGPIQIQEEERERLVHPNPFRLELVRAIQRLFGIRQPMGRHDRSYRGSNKRRRWSARV